MVRLIGIGGALVVVAVIGLFLGFGAYFVEDSEGQARVAPAGLPSTNSLSVTVDPACLWPVLDASFSPDAPPAPTRLSLQDCAPPGAEIEADGDWIRVSLQRGKPGDADVERRYSGVRIARRTEGNHLVLEAYDNWGGSGVFSSLILGSISGDGRELSDIKVHAFGDRCNGGLARTGTASDGHLLARANMTPWDIMMVPLSDLPFDDQWDAGKSRYGDAFGRAPSCAVCCSAVTREYVTDRQGNLTSVGLRYDPSAAPSTEDILGVCLEEAVRQVAGANELLETAEQAALGSLIDACAKDISY